MSGKLKMLDKLGSVLLLGCVAICGHAQLPQLAPAPRFLGGPVLTQETLLVPTLPPPPSERQPERPEKMQLFLPDPLQKPQVADTPTPSPPATTPVDAPLGFAGLSRIRPRDLQTDERFVPIEDRWRIGFPPWDRYGNGHPRVDDYPY